MNKIKMNKSKVQINRLCIALHSIQKRQLQYIYIHSFDTCQKGEMSNDKRQTDATCAFEL